MKKIFFAAAAAMLFAGCANDATDDIRTSHGEESTTEIVGVFESVRTYLGDNGREVLWKLDDRIGVFTDMDANAPFTLKAEYDGRREGRFAGSLSDGATVACAYYPYSASAGDNAAAVAVEIASEQTAADFAANDLAVASADANGVLVFRSKAAILDIALTNVSGSMLDGKHVEKIRIAAKDRDLTGSFLLDATDADAALAAVKTYPAAALSLPDKPAASNSTAGIITVNPSITASDEIRISILADGVWYGYTTAAKQALTAGKRYDVAIDCSKCGYVLAAAWAYGANGGLTSFNSHTPAIDGEGNVYVTTKDSYNLLKISPDGELLWSRQVGLSTTQNTSPSIEADGSVVYACGGNATNSRIRAFTPDGTEKWVFTSDKFFGNGNTPSPNFNQMAPAIGSKCLYIGNAGTTGTVLAIDKATGERVAYVSNKTDGTGGPTGGVASGMALSSEGVVAWFCNYGLFGADASLLDNPTQTHATYGAYVPYGGWYGYSWAWKNSNSAVACTTIDGTNCIAAAGIEGTSNGTYNMHVYAVPADGCLGSAPAKSQSWKFRHGITDVKQQDQGGIVVGARGELIVSLKNNNGDGGVYAVSTDGQKAWQFKCGADVAGAAAVDNEGNVHVADDNGTYHIIRPNYEDGSCTTLASADVFELVREAGFDVGDAVAARMWTSVMIGDDGAVYLGCELHDGNWSKRYGTLVKLTYGGCTGAGNTPWPMKYADCRHSCVQKTVE